MMNSKRLALGLSSAVGVLSLSFVLNAEPPEVPAKGPVSKPASATPAKPAGVKTASVEEARERARLLHDVYAATLDSLHHHYFRRDRAVLPARALEDVFAEIDEKTKIQSRWIAVNTPAMSVSHEPVGAFEKKAAEEIASGKSSYEIVEKGYYRRAGAIPLSSGCVGCHVGAFAAPAKTPRFAGLVIGIPVNEK